MSEWSTTAGLSKVTRLTARVKGRMGCWAVVMWDETGLVIINSDHGSWMFRWLPEHLPVDTMVEFLLRIDCGYMGGKMVDGPLRSVLDPEGTVAFIKATVLECRREHGDHGAEYDLLGWTRERARAEWDLAESVIDEHTWGDWMRETTLSDAYEYRSDKMNRSWRNFWDQIWTPGIVPALQELKDTNTYKTIDVVRKPTKGAST